MCRTLKNLLCLFVCLNALTPALSQERRRPGSEREIKVDLEPKEDSKIESSADDQKTVNDRWRYFYNGKFYDPYNTNILKGDLPIFGSQKNPWFLELGLISDTLAEYRDVPTPVGAASTRAAQSNDIFGDGKQLVLAETLTFLFSLYQGNTAFKPPNFEFRFVPAFQYSFAKAGEDGALRADPRKGHTRHDYHFGIQELFLDYHIADISDRYDFVSVRAGLQLFNADFRGFLFNSFEPGLRFFGSWDNNLWQYNLAYFRRLDKDTNSGLNIFWEDHHEDIFLANVYRQDFLIKGYTVQALIAHRENRARSEPNDYDDNGFLIRPASIGDERPKNISSTYLGMNSDGHIDRINISSALYFVFGEESHNPIAGRQTNIMAWMGALELSYDFDWIRIRGSAFWASGDSDPFDNKAEGFDAIFDNPNFAGGEASFWQRQAILFLGGGLVPLVNRNSLLPNLRAGKEEGQSNFVNPGLRLFNLGADFELTPKIKLITNFNFLQFDEIAVIKALRQDGSVSQNIGYDFSTELLYRPFLNNNVQTRLGAALFVPENAYENLFGSRLQYQTFANLILEY